MNPDPLQIYNANIEKYTREVGRLNKLTKRISLLRLFVFLVSALLIYWFATLHSLTGIFLTILPGIGLFLYLIKYHSRIISAKKTADALLQINQNEIKALSHDFSPFNPGDEFTDHSHPYASDIDIFGKGSVFQLLNRSATHPGASGLAALLCNPYKNAEDIRDNQKAVEELRDRLPFRQKFRSIGMVHAEKKGDDMKIRDWTAKKPLFGHPVFLVAVIIVPLFTALMIILLSLGMTSGKLFLLWLCVPWGIAGSFVTRTNTRHSLVSKTSELLEKYAGMLLEIEGMDFQSARLSELKRKLLLSNACGSKSIKALKSVLSALDNRLNPVSWTVLNGLLLWDILQMIRLEKWQRKYRNKVDEWFDVIAETDVLNSLANFAFNRPSAVFPEISEHEFRIVAKNAGHPMITENVRVDNNFEITEGEFTIITGANMAGKSTYLRTIGINLVLAMCGAPVIAEKFIFKPVDLYTSIRTTDSLFKNESYFYAELKRLSQIIDELRRGKKMFIILDEILKGTNSRDKHKGSEALLKQFLSLKATGIVATHDVSLGFLEERFPDHIKNRCFEVDISGQELSFDYKLRDGISKNMNATLLMQKMGITI